MFRTSFFIACVFLTAFYNCKAQVGIGASFSTFHLPAPQFRTAGLSVEGQLESDESTVFSLSIGYYTKKEGNSEEYIPTGSTTPVYESYTDKFSFLSVSADFTRYLIGNTLKRNKVSVYVGGGGGFVQKQQLRSYDNHPGENYKDIINTFGFEFLLGMDIKVGFAKLFARGKANILLKHLFPDRTDKTTLPLLTNTQIGIVIPLKK